MLITTNITNSNVDTDRYRDAEDVRAFCRMHCLDGLELMPVGGSFELSCIPESLVVGIHLPFYTNWYDFWVGDEAALMDEYQSMEVVRSVYGGDQPSALLDALRKHLDFAQKLRAKYVVFHVSNVTLPECMSYRFKHTDAEICRAAAEFINRLLDGRNDSFVFLVENLWWPGLTMTRPEVTRELMESIHTPRKGIMLDTGHMMHTNHSLRTQNEALEYIHRQLDAHGSMCDWIRGIHLHQSLSGSYVREAVKRDVQWKDTYWERRWQSTEHVLKIDRHEPFDTPNVRALIERIAPAYLTHEFITNDRGQHDAYLQTQNRAVSE